MKILSNKRFDELMASIYKKNEKIAYLTEELNKEKERVSELEIKVRNQRIQLNSINQQKRDSKGRFSKK